MGRMMAMMVMGMLWKEAMPGDGLQDDGRDGHGDVVKGGFAKGCFGG